MSAAQENYIPALRYRWLTPFYDAIVGLTTREQTFKTALVAQAALKPGERVLDLACGTATLTLMAKRAQPQAEIIGLDGDPEILNLARQKAARSGLSVRFDQGYSTELPYPPASFDCVLSSLFFHHLSREAKRQTLAEVVRVLKPNGRLHIADWGTPTSSLMRLAFYGIQLLDGFETTADNVEGRLPEFVREAGFDSVEKGESFSTMFGTMSLISATVS